MQGYLCNGRSAWKVWNDCSSRVKWLYLPVKHRKYRKRRNGTLSFFEKKVNILLQFQNMKVLYLKMAITAGHIDCVHYRNPLRGSGGNLKRKLLNMKPRIKSERNVRKKETDNPRVFIHTSEPWSASHHDISWPLDAFIITCPHITHPFIP